MGQARLVGAPLSVGAKSGQRAPASCARSSIATRTTCRSRAWCARCACPTGRLSTWTCAGRAGSGRTAISAGSTSGARRSHRRPASATSWTLTRLACGLWRRTTPQTARRWRRRPAASLSPCPFAPRRQARWQRTLRLQLGLVRPALTHLPLGSAPVALVPLQPCPRHPRAPPWTPAPTPAAVAPVAAAEGVAPEPVVQQLRPCHHPHRLDGSRPTPHPRGCSARGMHPRRPSPCRR